MGQLQYTTKVAVAGSRWVGSRRSCWSPEKKTLKLKTSNYRLKASNARFKALKCNLKTFLAKKNLPYLNIEVDKVNGSFDEMLGK